MKCCARKASPTFSSMNERQNKAVNGKFKPCFVFLYKFLLLSDGQIREAEMRLGQTGCFRQAMNAALTQTDMP